MCLARWKPRVVLRFHILSKWVEEPLPQSKKIKGGSTLGIIKEPMENFNMERKKIEKFVTYTSERLGKVKKGYGILSVDYREETISFEVYKGPEPKIRDLLYFLISDIDVQILIIFYRKQKPFLMEPAYKITTGGGERLIHIYMNKSSTDRQLLVSFSKITNKVSYIGEIYIGDLLKMVEFFNENQPSCYPKIENFDCNYLQSKTSFKYEKEV